VYSTSNDPGPKAKRQRGRTLSAAQKEAQEARKRTLDAIFSNKPVDKYPKVVVRSVRIERDPVKIGHENRMALEGLKKAFQQKRFEDHMRRKRPVQKGSSRSRRGVYDDDAQQTAHYSRLVIDGGSAPIGDGDFIEGKPGEPGKFVPAGESMPEPEDFGPYCIGDQFVRNGKMRHPGTDLRRYDQLPTLQQDKGPLVPDDEGFVRGGGEAPSRQEGGWRRSEKFRENDILDRVSRGEKWMSEPAGPSMSTRKIFKKK